MDKAFYTYVLLSKNDMNMYSGFTQNVKLRFEQHEKGFMDSTKQRLAMWFSQNKYTPVAQILFHRVNESRESNYWLRIIERKGWVKEKRLLKDTIRESSELKRIFGKIYSGRSK